MRQSRLSIPAVLCVLALCASSWASLQSNVLALTGNTRAKMVWVRATSSASDFTKTYPGLYNSGIATTLMCYTTDETSPRVLDAVVSQHVSPIITRSGEYCIWNDIVNDKAMIIKMDGTGKGTLLSTGNCYVLCCQWNAATQKEYIYTTNTKTAGTIPTDVEEPLYTWVYRMEFANGSANTSTSTQVMTTDLSRAPMLVSGDGLLAGVNIWPAMSVANLSTGAWTDIPVPSGFNCWANMSPGTTHRFFHFNGSHTALRMFDVYTSTTPWLVTIANKLPGNKSWGEPIDAGGPRFSNDVNYLSVSYPLQSDQSLHAGEFCIGRFNAGFTDANFVLITDTTDANRDKIGDLWVATGEGPNKTEAQVDRVARAPTQALAEVAAVNGGMTVSFAGNGPSRAQLLNSRGQVVASHTGLGAHAWAVPAQSLRPGTYLLAVNSEGRQYTREVYVCR